MNLFGKHIKYIFFYTKQLLIKLLSQGSKHSQYQTWNLAHTLHGQKFLTTYLLYKLYRILDHLIISEE